ncbi:hypothetical protein C1646_668865 [Rhizophagus diaphanus]|nr:hypothetical protein C1646_668865 [Rhizophagus diaphanus] [Rhizophagus sp. MUCL 43196]
MATIFFYGIFDTDDLNKDILQEIAHTIRKCAYGIKAILFVVEAKWFMEEQKEMINRIKTFLREEALQYMISIFSHCNRKQTENPEYFKKYCWNDSVKALSILWVIDGVYTNDLFKKARKKQAENARIMREAEEKRQKEYNEIKQREGEGIARANYKRQRAEDEKKAREAHDKELEFIIRTLKEQIKNLNKKKDRLSDEIDKLKNNDQLTTTHYVFNVNLSIIFSKNLRPGKMKIFVSDDNNRLIPVFVDDVTNEWHDKYISFYTRAGSVIANGVLCSCYDHYLPSQTLMNLVFLPVRWWTRIIPSTHHEERLHPYVQFLETAYLSFINVMKKIFPTSAHPHLSHKPPLWKKKNSKIFIFQNLFKTFYGYTGQFLNSFGDKFWTFFFRRTIVMMFVMK